MIRESSILNFIIFLENERQFFARFCMHLRLEILIGIAISPIVIGPNGAPLQRGRVEAGGGGGGPHPLSLIRLARCIVQGGGPNGAVG